MHDDDNDEAHKLMKSLKNSSSSKPRYQAKDSTLHEEDIKKFRYQKKKLNKKLLQKKQQEQ